LCFRPLRRILAREEAAVIELTEQQIAALNEPHAGPTQAVNPVTRETYVLLSLEEYRRLKAVEYDDTGWTRDELHTQAWEAGRSLGWDTMDERNS
jgi:hypothetical protein